MRVEVTADNSTGVYIYTETHYRKFQVNCRLILREPTLDNFFTKMGFPFVINFTTAIRNIDFDVYNQQLERFTKNLDNDIYIKRQKNLILTAMNSDSFTDRRRALICGVYLYNALDKLHCDKYRHSPTKDYDSNLNAIIKLNNMFPKKMSHIYSNALDKFDVSPEPTRNDKYNQLRLLAMYLRVLQLFHQDYASQLKIVDTMLNEPLLVKRYHIDNYDHSITTLLINTITILDNKTDRKKSIFNSELHTTIKDLQKELIACKAEQDFQMTGGKAKELIHELKDISHSHSLGR